MDVVSRLTDVVPLGGRDRTSNPSWPRGAPPVGASRRDFTHLAAPGEDPVGRPSTGVRIPPPPPCDAASAVSAAIDGDQVPGHGHL